MLNAARGRAGRGANGEQKAHGCDTLFAENYSLLPINPALSSSEP